MSSLSKAIARSSRSSSPLSKSANASLETIELSQYSSDPKLWIVRMCVLQLLRGDELACIN